MAKLIQWPNKLGWDFGPYEIFDHKESLDVHGPQRSMLVPKSFTTDPVVAARCCHRYGLWNYSLEEMDPKNAEREYKVHPMRFLGASTPADLELIG